MKKFEGVPVGTKVRDCRFSDVGEVYEIDNATEFPITVVFPGERYDAYTLEGYSDIDEGQVTLFYDNGYQPQKDAGRPLPDIPENTVVFVWDEGEGPKDAVCMYFKGFAEDGSCLCSARGDNNSVEYDHFSLENPLLKTEIKER